MGDHKPLYIVVILFNILVLAAALVINYGASGPGADWGIFKNNTGDISDKYHTEVTPSGRTFLIWTVIYAYQILWVIYSLTLLCRRSDGGYLYYSPPFMPIWLYIVYWLNLAANITWLFLWDRQHMIVGCAMIALLAVLIWIDLVISVYSVSKYADELIQQDKKADIWWVRALVHNALGMYGTWVTIATHLNLAIVLIYDVGMDDVKASSIALGILAFITIVWFILDNFALDKFTRYLFTPYIVLIWACVGIIVENWDSSKLSSILTAVLLSIGGIIFIVKLSLVIMRSCKNPEPLTDESSRAHKHRV